jgi:DegV family protein with EDD domain
LEKIALITDSTTGLLESDIDKYGIHVIRLKVIYKEREYVDGIEITPEEVYDRLEEEVPTTSMPSVQEVMDLYEKLVAQGYTHAIVMPISSGLSGTINSFIGASEHYKDKLKFFIFDTKIISMPFITKMLKGMPFI